MAAVDDEQSRVFVDVDDAAESMLSVWRESNWPLGGGGRRASWTPRGHNAGADVVGNFEMDHRVSFEMVLVEGRASSRLERRQTLSR